MVFKTQNEQWWCSKNVKYITEWISWTSASILIWADTLCLSQGGAFSSQIHAASKETNTEAGTAQALLNG